MQGFPSRVNEVVSASSSLFRRRQHLDHTLVRSRFAIGPERKNTDVGCADLELVGDALTELCFRAPGNDRVHQTVAATIREIRIGKSHLP